MGEIRHVTNQKKSDTNGIFVMKVALYQPIRPLTGKVEQRAS